MIEIDRIGPALRLLRRRRGLLQVEVAERAGITKAMLSSYERGKRLPSLRSLVAVLNAQRFDFEALDLALACFDRRRRRSRRGLETLTEVAEI